MVQQYVPLSDALRTANRNPPTGTPVPPVDALTPFSDVFMPLGGILSVSRSEFEEYFGQGLGLDHSSTLIGPPQVNQFLPHNDMDPLILSVSDHQDLAHATPQTLSSDSSSLTSPSKYGTPPSTTPLSNMHYMALSPPLSGEYLGQSHALSASARLLSDTQAPHKTVSSEPYAQHVSHPTTFSRTLQARSPFEATSSGAGSRYSSYSSIDPVAEHHPVRLENSGAADAFWRSLTVTMPHMAEGGGTQDLDVLRSRGGFNNHLGTSTPLLNAYPTGRPGESIPMPMREEVDRVDFSQHEPLREWVIHKTNYHNMRSVSSMRVYGAWLYKMLQLIEHPPFHGDDKMENLLEQARERGLELLGKYDPATYGKDVAGCVTSDQDASELANGPVQQDASISSESPSELIDESPSVPSQPIEGIRDAQLEIARREPVPTAPVESVSSRIDRDKTKSQVLPADGSAADGRPATSSNRKNKSMTKSKTKAVKARSKRPRSDDDDALSARSGEESNSKHRRTTSVSTAALAAVDAQSAVSSAGYPPSTSAGEWIYPQSSRASGIWEWDQGGRQAGYATQPRTRPAHDISSSLSPSSSGYHRYHQHPTSDYGASTSFTSTATMTTAMTNEALTPRYPIPTACYEHTIPTMRYEYPVPMTGYGYSVPNFVPSGVTQSQARPY